ncbi:MAG: acyltransferase [Pseudomonadota bacterium]|nr:acyltransferase [Pseudomonadota bacterium]
MAVAQPLRLHYLDGLRGWAALVVVIFHSTWGLFSYYLPPMRTTSTGLINDGKLAVYVFFVLSGFVLAHPYLRTGTLQLLQRTALSRYTRLTIPIAAASFLALVLMRMGWLFNVEANAIVDTRKWLAIFYLQTPTIGSWAKFSFYNVFFRYDESNSYDVFLWTMPFELAGSLLVFGVLALAGPKRLARTLWYAAAGILCYREAPMLLCFVYGMVLAEVSLVPTVQRINAHWIADVAGLLLLFIAFECSVHLRETYSPERCAWIALLIVTSAVVSRPLRYLLETAPSRFLGKVSFPLYLIHSLVICSLASLLIIRLDRLGISHPVVVAITAPLTIAVSLLAATAFAPIERWAIQLSRSLADVVFGRRQGGSARQWSPTQAVSFPDLAPPTTRPHVES